MISVHDRVISAVVTKCCFSSCVSLSLTLAAGIPRSISHNLLNVVKGVLHRQSTLSAEEAAHNAEIEKQSKLKQKHSYQYTPGSADDRRFWPTMMLADNFAGKY